MFYTMKDAHYKNTRQMYVKIPNGNSTVHVKSKKPEYIYSVIKPLIIISLLYITLRRGGQFYWWKKEDCPLNYINLLYVTNTIHHIRVYGVWVRARLWMGIKLTPLSLICTDSKINGSYRYHIQTLQEIVCILRTDNIFMLMPVQIRAVSLA